MPSYFCYQGVFFPQIAELFVECGFLTWAHLKVCFLLLFIAVVSSDNECSDYFAVVQIPKPAEFEWQLSLVEEENKMVRGEFFYEQVSKFS